MKRLKQKHRKVNRLTKDETHFNNIFDNNVNFKERVIYLNDDIDSSSLELFQKAFDEFDRTPDQPVRVEISSYGGSVYDMLGMIDRIRNSPCHVVTRGLGKIMSAATFILGAGDERLMGKNSWAMIHEISDWIRGSLSELKVELKHTEELEAHCYRLYEEFSKGKTKAKVFEKMCSKNCYLTAEQTLKLGLIDEII